MHGEGFFFQAFVYLLAAVVAVPIAKRVGLGSVLGYLLAGVAIGPFGLGLVGEHGEDVLHFAEFGVVMMLFLVGLELEPKMLWRLRVPVLGMGGLQVLLTTLVITALAVALGVPWRAALALAMILALSSTAIVLQTLTEKGLMRTAGGQSAFAVLLFQDIAVIPMLALLPMLAAPGAAHHDGGHGGTWIDGLPGWGAALVVLGALGAVIASGRFLARPLFGAIARTRLRETFTAAALLLVIGVALLMTKLGLSPALGTFVAGVVFASSEYRHELESEIEPFKGLLLGLFFLSVGATIDFDAVAARPGLIAGLVTGLMVVKFVVLLVLGRGFRMSLDQNLLLAFALAQSGEFAFVLFSFATQNGVIPTEVAAPLVASVALTMALTPLAMVLYERVVAPRLGTRERETRPEDDVHGAHPVIVAGYGRFGQIAGRLLGAQGVDCTLLDIDSDQVDLVRRFGARVFYGDATRPDLLRAAGAEQARLLIIAIDDPEKALALAHTAHKHFPHLRVLARATGRGEALALIEAGVQHIYRETFDASLRLGTDALKLLGMRAYAAERAARSFRRYDEQTLRETAAERHDTQRYMALVRARLQNLEGVLRAEQRAHFDNGEDHAWDVSALRADAGSAPAEGGS